MKAECADTHHPDREEAHEHEDIRHSEKAYFCYLFEYFQDVSHLKLSQLAGGFGHAVMHKSATPSSPTKKNLLHLTTCRGACKLRRTRIYFWNFGGHVTKAAQQSTEEDFAGLDLSDTRLNKRAKRMMEHFSANPTASIPDACDSWSEICAAYRFLGNDDVDWEAILAPH